MVVIHLARERERGQKERNKDRMNVFVFEIWKGKIPWRFFQSSETETQENACVCAWERERERERERDGKRSRGRKNKRFLEQVKRERQRPKEWQREEDIEREEDTEREREGEREEKREEKRLACRYLRFRWCPWPWVLAPSSRRWWFCRRSVDNTGTAAAHPAYPEVTWQNTCFSGKTSGFNKE